MTSRARIALVGLGRMGQIHAGNLAARCPTAELACVVDADPAVAERVGTRLGVAWTTSVDEVLGADDVAAVAVATPTGTHAELIARAAHAGKHVFCEKPVSLDRAETVKALDAVREAGTTLQVGFHRRFDPDWLAVQQRIAAGDLGRPYLFRTSLRDMRSPNVEFLAGSGGFFVDVTIHDLDVARWLVGEVVEISAHGAALSDPAFEGIGDVDTAVVVLRFENGALGVIDGSRCAGYGYECSTEIMGSLATARVDNPPPHNYEWLTPGLASHELPRDFEQRYPHAYADELEAFATCVRDDTPPRVSGRDALAAFDLATAADASWRHGSRVALQPRRDPDGILYEIGDPSV
jgi:myo-inositol 2-dehydrogenase / D-chiro-inositol 1-dehydrogenase